MRDGAPPRGEASAIAAAVEDLFGIVTPDYRLDGLRRALVEIGGDGNVATGLARVAAGGPEAIHRLESAASIPETFLFRHPGHFKILDRVARERLELGLPTRVLSAGASTGEEAWSAAAVLAGVGHPDAGRHRVHGWELSRERVEMARRGRFNPWSARSGLDGYGRWFDVDEDDLVATSALREMVTFERVNLTAPALPDIGPVDVLFFRNVSIYWNPTLAARVMSTFAGLMAAHGVILVGPTDPVTAPGPGWEHTIEHGVRRISRSTARDGAVATKDENPTLHRAALRPADRPSDRPERRRPDTGKAPDRPALSATRHRPATSADSAPTLALVADLADRGLYSAALDALADSELPNDATRAKWTGILELNLERADSAMRSFRRAVFLAPDDPVARQWLAVAFDNLGRSEEAARERRNAAVIHEAAE